MKIDFPLFKGVVVGLLLAAAGFFALPFVAPLAGLPGKSLFAVALLIGTVLGGLLSTLRFEAKPAGAAPRAVSAAADSGDRKTVFVGNLAYRAGHEDVRDLFAPFGEVHSVRLMTDRVTRRPRGFGFVEMDAAAADRAIRELNGHDFMGRDLKVNEGKQREPRMDRAA